MPSGKSHMWVTIMAAATTPPIVHLFYSGATLSNLIAVSLGCLTGVVLSPDLDVNSGNISYRTIRKQLGNIPAGVWRTLWTPYAFIIPHRSWISHAPVIGTALRLGYLYLIIIIISILVTKLGFLFFPQLNLPFRIISNQNFLWVFIGLSVADILHFTMDLLFSKRK